MAITHADTLRTKAYSSGCFAVLPALALFVLIAISPAANAQTSIIGWGENNFGQLGDGTTNATANPVLATPIAGPPEFGAIANGEAHTLLLSAEGRVFSCGKNMNGQLGSGGVFTWRTQPLPVVTMGTALDGKVVQAISAGADTSLAITSDGILCSWGDNSSGSLGRGYFGGFDGLPGLVQLPITHTVPIATLPKIAAAAVGWGHCLAVDTNGILYAWGYNGSGQLGRGDHLAQAAPVTVAMVGAASGKLVQAVAAGWGFSLALTTDGTVLAWGSNDKGQLGNGTYSESNVPVPLTSGALAGKKVVAISAGIAFSMALTSEGKVVTWGGNADHQLGNNSFSNSNVPVAVTISAALTGRTVTAIAAGGGHALALSSDGHVAAWGSNSRGQLSNAVSGASSGVPVLVAQTRNPLAGKVSTCIAAGNEFSLSLNSVPVQHGYWKYTRASTEANAARSSRLNGWRTGVASLVTANTYYYKGTDQNVWRLTLVNGQWAQARVNSNGNVDDWFTIGKAPNQLYYRGTDGRIWALSLATATANAVPISTFYNVSTDVQIDTSNNTLFYHGTDNNLWTITRSGTQWTTSQMTNDGEVTGGIAVDSALHRTYYLKFDRKLWSVSLQQNSWQHVALTNGGWITGDVVATLDGGAICEGFGFPADRPTYFVGRNGTTWLQNMLPVGGQHNGLNTTYGARGCIYSGADGAAHTFGFINNAWKQSRLGPVNVRLCDSLSVNPLDGRVYGHTVDGNLAVFTYVP